MLPLIAGLVIILIAITTLYGRALREATWDRNQ